MMNEQEWEFAANLLWNIWNKQMNEEALKAGFVPMVISWERVPANERAAWVAVAKAASGAALELVQDVILVQGEPEFLHRPLDTFMDTPNHR